MSETLELTLQDLVKEAKKYQTSDIADRLDEEQIRETLRVKGLEQYADEIVKLVFEMWEIGFIEFVAKYSDSEISLVEYGIYNADELPTKTIEIEVQISDDEKLEIAQQQNELLEKKYRKELEAKRIASDFRIEIQALEQQISQLHSDWQRPFDIEFHSVRYFIDKENKVVHYFALNTNKLIKTEPLQPPTAGEKSLFGGVEADDVEFPDFDTSEETTNEFLEEINAESEPVEAE